MKKHLPLITFSFLIAISFCQAQNPILWGMTAQGGAIGWGTIFNFDINSGTQTKVSDFSPSNDGEFPEGSLIRASDDLLYGMTSRGGTNHYGIIFSYDISTGKEIDLHDFGSGTGREPTGTLIQATDGLLYGMTFDGGINGTGIIFSFDISTGKETDLHGFGRDTADGIYPIGSLIQATNGLLYGMTQNGGNSCCRGGLGGGTIFSYDISTKAEKVLHDFGDSTDGQLPAASLLQASNGLLYGMTSKGGEFGRGIIFSYDISTGTETKLHEFGIDKDGQFPFGSLIQASNGLLYGMTFDGGIYRTGIIFSYDISTGKETDLHDFGIRTDGVNPQGSLIQASNGLLYGMTSHGGINGVGTIFSYDISTGTETDIHDFSCCTNGEYPVGDLLEVDDTTTGINPRANTSNNIQLFPNPSSTSFHFSLTLQKEQLISLTLYNTLGQHVWAEDLGKTKRVETEIPVSKFATGVYILKINSGGESVQKQIVVEK